MKAMRLAVATCAVLVATAGVARADLILLGATPQDAFIDLGAQGFGNAPRMLTLQTTGIESGWETPVDVEHGDAVNGANKSTTPTLAALGWNIGADVGIGFNSSQVGGDGITLDSLVLTLYNGTNAVGSFQLANPIFFTEPDLHLENGNGTAVFAFGLDATEQAEFNALLSTYGSGLYAGLGATLGCPAAGAPVGCQQSNDGPDSFVGFDRAVTTPDGGGTFVLLGLGLLGLGYINARKMRA